MGCCSSQNALSSNSSDGSAEKEFACKANSDLVDTIKFLRGTPTFSVLKPREYPILAAACSKEVYLQGEVLYVGSGSEEFFVVKRGEASVWLEHPCSPVPFVPPTPTRRSSKDATPIPRRSGRLSYISNSGGSEVFDSHSSSHEMPSNEMLAKRHSVLSSAPTLNSARAVGGQVKVAVLRSTDYFGEYALMGGETWDVSIVVESEEMEVIKITKENFDKLGLSSRLRIPKRERVYLSRTRAQNLGPSASSSNKPRTKDQSQRAWIEEKLLSLALLQVFFNSQEAMLEKLVDVAWKQECSEGQVLIKGQSDPCLYLVKEGSLRVSNRREEEDIPANRRSSFLCAAMEEGSLHSPDYDQVSTNGSGSTIGSGSCYGECTLLYDTAHLVQVKTTAKTVLWVIDQDDFAEAVRLAHQAKLERYVEYLETVPLFSSLLSDEKLTVAKTLLEQTWTCGQELYREGEVNRTFTILLEGEVCVLKRGGEMERLLVVPGDPSYPVRHLGQETLTQHDVVHDTTVRVVSLGARTLALALGSKAIEAYLGPLRNLLQQVPHGASEKGVSVTDKPKSRFGTGGSLMVPPSPPRISKIDSGENSGSPSRSPRGSGGQQSASGQWSPSQAQVRRENFRPLTILGRGGFGIVELCEDATTKKYYALKTVKKARVAGTEFLRTQILNEKYILEMTGSRFIIRLFGTDKDEQDLYFILEPALGGELLATYRSRKLFGDEALTRYYAASVVCAFEHLHERCIIYRDLKPENLMLDQSGHLKLTDMGLAKFAVGRTFTVCGTPVYFAPEVAKQIGYDCAVDWWQLGVLTWELLTGRTPFPANTRGEAFYWLFTEKVLMTLSQPDHLWPSRMPGGHARDFLKALLVYDPSRRVPMMPGGMERIRENPWFKDFCWPELQSGTMEAPYQPPSWDPLSKSTNDNFFVSDLVAATDPEAIYISDGTGWDADF